ncbi:MAG: sulfite exporter TauE/SafE family protein [Proteobacteria bacterium]|nr:sulfite exporter TauE/SafE family protein [Pseudomonadota bacterium]
MSSIIWQLPILELAIVAVSAFAAGICSGMTGFGGGLLLPPILAPLLGVQNVMPVLSVAMLMTNCHRFWLYHRYLDKRLTLIVLAAMIPAVVLGTMIYLSLPHDAIALVLGGFLLLSIPLGRMLAAREIRLRPVGLAGFGAAFGVIAGTTSGSGVLIVPVLLGAGLAGTAFLATDAAISIAVNLTRAGMFGHAGDLQLDILSAALMIGLCTVPGNYVARWILRRTSLRLHSRIMECVVFIGGVTLLWWPLRSLLAGLSAG